MVKKFKADDLDLAILREIRENSKESYRKLAEKLGVHPNTIIQRIKRLEDEKVILKYSTDIDYRKVGFDIHALILMKVKRGIAGDAKQVENLLAMPQIQALYAITGTYDVVALLRARDREEMAKILAKITENKEIMRTNTAIMLHTYKQPYDFNPLLGSETSK